MAAPDSSPGAPTPSIDPDAPLSRVLRGLASRVERVHISVLRSRRYQQGRQSEQGPQNEHGPHNEHGPQNDPGRPTPAVVVAEQLLVLSFDLRDLAAGLYNIAMLASAFEDELGRPLANDIPLVMDCCQLVGQLDRQFPLPPVAGAPLVGADFWSKKLAALRDQLRQARLAPSPAMLLGDQLSGPGHGDGPEIRVEELHVAPVTVATVRGWLQLLCRPEFGDAVEEHAVERTRLLRRRIQMPEYDTAARWTTHAAAFWPELEPDAMALLVAPAQRWNRTRWCAELARQHWPLRFGDAALSGRSQMQLTNMLCDLTTSALHIAAAMSLPEACRRIIATDGVPINQESQVGPPVLCALLGCHIFLLCPASESDAAGPPLWDSLKDHVPVPNRAPRINTVVALLEMGAQFPVMFHHRGLTISLASVALVICLQLGDAGLYFRILADWVGSVQDHIEGFLAVLGPVAEGKADLKTAGPTVLAQVLTGIIDWALPKAGQGISHSTLIRVASTVLRSRALSFAFVGRQHQEAALVPGLATDADFFNVVRWAIIKSQPVALQRLVLDPRWDSNCPRAPGDSRTGTILHLAAHTEDLNLEVLATLLGTRPSLEARDAYGRTALLSTRELATLKALIAAGCDTTSRDAYMHTVWHRAAAVNDRALLVCLACVDPYRTENLCAVDESGNTPLAVSILYHRMLDRRERVRTTPAAALFLLEYLCRSRARPGAGPGMDPFRSAESLLHVAAEWGNEALLCSLLEAGVRVSKAPGGPGGEGGASGPGEPGPGSQAGTAARAAAEADPPGLLIFPGPVNMDTIRLLQAAEINFQIGY